MQIRAFAAVPEACVAQRAIERHERHEDDARGAEIAEARKVVLAVGIDERRRLRQHLRRLMVIEHDHVEAKLARDLERLAADGAAVDGHHKRRASRRETLNRLDIGAVALGHAVGDMDDRLQPAGVQIFAEERRAARAIDVVVAEDGDLLMGHDRAPEALRRRGHIAQAKGVGHEIAKAWRQMAVNRIRQDAASGKHTGDQLVMAANLGDGERMQLPCRVKPRPPRLAERRGLNVEEVIGGRQNSALGSSNAAACKSLAAAQIMTECALDPEGFRAGRASVVPSRFRRSGSNARSWTGASGGCQLDWRDRANGASRSKRRPSRHHIRMEGQECLIFCRAFRCGP